MTKGWNSLRTKFSVGMILVLLLGVYPQPLIQLVQMAQPLM